MKQERLRKLLKVLEVFSGKSRFQFSVATELALVTTMSCMTIGSQVYLPGYSREQNRHVLCEGFTNTNYIMTLGVRGRIQVAKESRNENGNSGLVEKVQYTS